MEEHRTLLEVPGDPGQIVHVGGHGAGYTAKLLVNLLFGQSRTDPPWAHARLLTPEEMR